VAVNFYAAIPLMAVLAILQTAVLPRFPIAGLEPQLVFLVALAWGLLRGLEEGLVWAFIAGLWLDLFSMTPLGLSSLAFMAAVAGPVLLQGVLPPRRLPVAALMAALGTLVYLLFYAVALGLLGHLPILSTCCCKQLCASPARAGWSSNVARFWRMALCGQSCVVGEMSSIWPAPAL